MGILHLKPRSTKLSLQAIVCAGLLWSTQGWAGWNFNKCTPPVAGYCFSGNPQVDTDGTSYCCPVGAILRGQPSISRVAPAAPQAAAPVVKTKKRTLASQPSATGGGGCGTNISGSNNTIICPGGNSPATPGQPPKTTTAPTAGGGTDTGGGNAGNQPGAPPADNSSAPVATIGSQVDIGNGYMAGTAGKQVTLGADGPPQTLTAGYTQDGSQFVSGTNNTLMTVPSKDGGGNPTYWRVPNNAQQTDANGNSVIPAGAVQITQNTSGNYPVQQLGNGDTAQISTDGQSVTFMPKNGPGGFTQASSKGGSFTMLGSGDSITPNSFANAQNGNNPSGPSGGDKVLRSSDGLGDSSDFKTTDKNCNNSANVFGMTGCQATVDTLKRDQMISMGGQLVGTVGLGIQGQMGQQNLMMNGGSQVQAQQLAASMAQKAATLQTAIGATQLYFGYNEGNLADNHRSNADSLNQAMDKKSYKYTPTTAALGGGQAGVGQMQAQGGINSNKALNAAAAKSFNDGSAAPHPVAANMVTEVQKTAHNFAAAAQNEQNNMADQASGASQSNYVQGAVTTVSGLLAMAAANQARQAANAMANMQQPVGLPGGANTFSSNPLPTVPAIINSGAAPLTTPGPVPSMGAGAPGGSLGSGGFGGLPAGNSLAAMGPPAMPMQPGVGTAAGPVDGGGGLGGSTSTGAAPTSAADTPQAQYAGNTGSAAAVYQGGGAGFGGGSKGGGGSNPAIALKDAFAQLLGNGQGGQPASGVDITAYRNLASDAPFAPLPQGEDFFKYIHQAYQGLQKKGRIGL